MNCFFSLLLLLLILPWHSCYDLNNWTISPNILPLDWASTQSCMDIHFGFILSSNCLAVRQLDSSAYTTFLALDDPFSGCIRWLWSDDCLIALLTATVSGWTVRNGSTPCILHETASKFAKSSAIAVVTTVWIDSTWMVSLHFSHSILDKASASTLLFLEVEWWVLQLARPAVYIYSVASNLAVART